MDDRRKLANGKEIWVIKAGFPNAPIKKCWSEFIFSSSLKKYLERLGYFVVIESFDEWNDEGEADVVVLLRGHEAYYPDRKNKNCIYIMWNLSHPSTISDEEYNAYDFVCISSKLHAEKIKNRIKVPVKVLPMCADTEIFYPDTEPYAKKEYDWIFVGNSRYEKRKSVVWSIENHIPLKIWGANWDKVLPEYLEYVVADNISNDDLPDLYRKAKVTVDDHYEDMIRNGFINTRIVESLACGLPVISDDSQVLRDMFGDAILCYRDEEEFIAQTKYVVDHYDVVKEKVLALWPEIKEKYSFESNARCLAELTREIRKKDDWYRKSVNALIQYKPTGGINCLQKSETKEDVPKVSVIIPVYNTEKYLADCLDSVLGQSLKEIEVICIDDGSTDHSREILLEYAGRDSRMSVYAEENEGQSVARNRGIELAQGQYIYFIDSDDTIEKDALETLYQESYANKLDILYFNGTTVFEKDSGRKKGPYYKEYYQRTLEYPIQCTGEEMFAMMERAGEYRTSSVMQIYSCEFLKREKICYYPGIVNEDTDFSFRIALLASRAGYIANAFYNRRVREGSTMTVRPGIEHVYGYFRALTMMIDFAENYEIEHGIREETKESVYSMLSRIICLARKCYAELTWQEQRAFDELSGVDKIKFEMYIQPESYGLGEKHREYRENIEKERSVQKSIKELQEIKQRLQKEREQKKEINEKLQKTYAEKSEINRKLQITYGEKYDRGLEIKRLKKELEAVKRSRSYKLARWIGLPVRALRKVIRYLKSMQSQ